VSGAKLPADRPIGRDREEVSAAAEAAEPAPQQA